MPDLDPRNYSRHIPHPIPVARLVMPSVHSNVNFASVPINLVRNEAWAAVHNSLSPLDISCKQPWLIPGWRDSRGPLLLRLLHMAQRPLSGFALFTGGPDPHKFTLHPQHRVPSFL